MALGSIEEEQKFNKCVHGLYDVFASEEAVKLSQRIGISENLEVARGLLKEFMNKWTKYDISAVKLDIDSNLFKEIITELMYDRENNSAYRTFYYSLDELRMLDLSDLDFSSIVIDEIDFSYLTGVKIDPQTVNCGSLQCCNFAGVTFIGSFNYTQINGSNFTGSKGAVLDLNNIVDLRGICNHKTILTDAKVIKDEANAYKLNSDSIDTTGALIMQNNLQTVSNYTYNHQSVLSDLHEYLHEYLPGYSDDTNNLTRKR